MWGNEEGVYANCQQALPQSNFLNKAIMMTMPNLPQELIGAIIHFLHDDRISLRNCSIAAKSWSYWSRPHLFSEICFDYQPPNALEKLTRLEECLVSSPLLIQHIQCVELRNFSRDVINLEVAESVARILESLSDVRELRVRGASFRCIMSLETIRDVVFRFMQRGSLKHIALHHAVLSPSDFRQMLSLPPNLVALTLYDIRMHQSPTEVTSSFDLPNVPITPHPRDIKRLHIRGQIDPILVEWMTGSDSFLNLGALSHLYLSSLCYSGLGYPLVHAFASVIQHLEVYVYEQFSCEYTSLT
jgi:hypothetical protein